MIRKRKRYSRPRKAFDKNRIEEENHLVERYGLKNKKEIWKAEARVNDMRRQAKLLITADRSEQEKLINKLNKLGFSVSKIADILALNKENFLKRRLQSIIVEKKIASTPKAARQLIVHKHVTIEGNVVNIPGYIVPVNEENHIEVRLKEKKIKAENIK